MHSLEEIASKIRLEVARCPALPLAINPTYLDYLTTRIDEVVEIWRWAGVEPEYLSVLAAEGLLIHFRELKEYNGIAIDYVANPLANIISKDGLDEGTFSLEFYANHPASTWVSPALGIAYNKLVEVSRYNTRWVLQEIDGVEPEIAEQIAEFL